MRLAPTIPVRGKPRWTKEPLEGGATRLSRALPLNYSSFRQQWSACL